MQYSDEQKEAALAMLAVTLAEAVAALERALQNAPEPEGTDLAHTFGVVDKVGLWPAFGQAVATALLERRLGLLAGRKAALTEALQQGKAEGSEPPAPRGVH